MSLSFTHARQALVLSIALAAPAAAQEQLWIRQFGTSTEDYAHALCSDGAGGAFIGGDTLGSLGGPLVGQRDVWLARYDGAGNRLWIRQFGTDQSDYAYAITPDGAAGAFVAGATWGSLAGPNAGFYDGWLARYDSAGDRLWIRQLGTSGWDQCNALASDGTGGTFVGGWTTGILGGSTAGFEDAWLARYDAAGNHLWIRQFGTNRSDYVGALAPDGVGGAFVAGQTDGSLGGPNAGQADVWLARYDSSGNRLWIRQFGTSGTDTADRLATDGIGGAFVAGFTFGSLGGPPAGQADVWLARYDSAGNRLWIRQFGTSATEQVFALASDGAGGAFVAGPTAGSLGGPLAGDRDAWLARYDSLGNRSWIRQFGTPAYDEASALAGDGAGGAFVAGLTSGSLSGPNAGLSDAWLARWTGGPAPCYPDCNGDGALNLADFGCYQTKFALMDPYADCNGDGALNLADFGCFQTRFALGCP